MINQFLLRSLRTAHLFATLRLCLVLVAGLVVTSFADGQEKRHLRHILVANEQVANRLVAAIEGGSDFRALARRYSLDVGTKLLGGDLDWVVYGSMEPEFSAAAFKIKEPNDLAVCKTRYGWHVIQYLGSMGIPDKPQPDAGTSSDKPAVTPVPVTGDRNADLEWSVQFDKRAYAPGEPVMVTIGVRNMSENELDVLDPTLWPLGLIIRYQFGKLNVPMTVPANFDAAKMDMKKLASNEYLEKTFNLVEYAPIAEPWPIVRVIWRGDSLFGRIEKNVATLVDHPDYATWKSRWRFYRSVESQFNVLPPVNTGDRWFLCCFTNGRLWIELQDVGIPGLRQEIVSQVRSGNLDKIPIALTGKQLMNFGVIDRSEGGVDLAEPTSLLPWRRGSFGVARSGTSAGPKLGLQFGIGLAASPSSVTKMINCGSVVLEEGGPISRVEERVAKGLSAEMTLVLAYPYDLLPEKVKEAAAAETSKPEKVDTSQVKPSSSNQSPRLAGQDGTIPARKYVSDLPVVALNTSSGTITIELFENECPNTVANFISLVESGFYDGLAFHRKVATDENRGFIQGGSPDGTGSGGPGYRIADESSKKRPALKGSVIMARNHTVADTAGSQFLIALDRLTYLDAVYTVFGQVIEGQSTAQQLTEGSVIEKAVVKNKRDHDYVPVKIVEN